MSLYTPPPEERILKVSDLTRQICALFDTAYPEGVWVSGEVSNLSRPSSGHVYLKLKDAESQVSAVIYRGVALRMRFDLEDGLEVLVKARLTVYIPRGEYQLQVEHVVPRGIGSLELAFQQLRARLASRGYFDPQRKRPLPRFPRRVALVTSPTGAAVRDMLEIFRRRWPALEVWVVPVPVQGEGAAAKIAEAIAAVNRLQGIDVLIVGRGGGSLEDLWPFNEEVLARAIYESRIPVVSGVGHETDLTIADLVADVRALTPSEAAERVAPNRAEYLETLAGMAERMRVGFGQKLATARTRLQHLSRRPCFERPLERIRAAGQRLRDLGERLQRASASRWRLTRQRLEALAGRLGTVSPLNVLARGYSVTRKEGSVLSLRSAADVAPGDRLITRLWQGEVISRVESTRQPPVPGEEAGHE